MKELKPIINTRFKCDFCSKIYAHAANCKEHENECYKNPDRHCPTCGDTGWESWDTLGDNLGVIPDGDGRECSKCKIAEIYGGKSYIEK